jgi:hypothetical protein
MSNTHTISPESNRERQIAHGLGLDGWEIIDQRDRVICLNEQPGFLIRKNGYVRWIRQERVR